MTDRLDLVVNADDLGMHPTVNTGIARAYDDGMVSSTSVMPAGDAFHDAVDVLADRDGLGRGVHVALTGVDPVLPPDEVPGLVGRDGRLPALPRFVARTVTGEMAWDAVEQEVAAQLRRAARIPGLDHVDVHRHLHLLPPVRRAVRDVAARHGLPVVRRPVETLPWTLPGLRSGYLPRTLLSPRMPLGVAAAVMAGRDRGVAFAGLVHAGRMDPDRVAAFLRANTASPLELCLHPGTGTVDGIDRRRDLAAAVDVGVADVVADRYVLRRFEDIPQR